MSVLNENTIIGASAAGEYEIEQSLRFDSGSSNYLEWTPSISSTSTRTFTLSTWIKLGNLKTGSDSFIWCGQNVSGTTNCDLNFKTSSGQYYFQIGANGNSVKNTSKLRRDVSAWYHLVAVFDTTQATDTNRIKLYVNGVQSTISGTFPSQNTDFDIGGSNKQMLGALNLGSAGRFFDGYMGEVNFIDGLALTPDSFGETGDYGEWKPIAYDGTYGTNGFYLPFKQDYAVEGFSTVTYEGNGGTQYIGGVGFQSDLSWIKNRVSTPSHRFFDSVRGVERPLFSNLTNAESSETGLTSFDSDGFTLGSHGGVNTNGNNHVAWNWDMGGTTASNTSGSITSSVRANTTYGQSIVSYTGNATSGATIGHGLNAVPKMIIVKDRSSTNPWVVYHHDLGINYYTLLNDTDSSYSNLSNYWSGTTPSSTVFGVNTYGGNNANGDNYIAYCFSDVTGYSKFGSYSGSGSAGKAITTGFAPAFVMVKRTDSANNWLMYDNTRSPNNPNGHILFANLSDAESVETSNNIVDFDSNGFTLESSLAATNASGGTYIYAAFADTREYAYWYDQSGNNNDWTSNDLTESDVMVDSPTNNFATLNPLDKSGTVTLSEGNLKYVNNTGVVRGTIAAGASSKFYLEYCQVSAINSGNPIILGIGTTEGLPAHESAHVQSMVVHCDGNNQKAVRVFVDNSQVQATSFDALTAITTGGILMFAYDGATGKAWVGINGSWLQGNPATGASPIYTFSNTDTRPMTAFVDHAGVTNTGVINFGQDSSFAGAKTPQGNADSGGIGDFYYAPSSGFLALCTSNLPSVDAIPSEHFNTVLYTGNQAANVAVTGVGFQPDLVWGKNRSSASNHWLFDSVRGINKMLQADQASEEETQSGVRAFNSFGFTLGTWIGSTKTNDSYVAWNWKAGGTASSNTNGSITSSVSANPAAGFSIVSYTGNGTSGATVGHGLASAPTMFIVKRRITAGDQWAIYHQNTSGSPATTFMEFTTAAVQTATTRWNDTAPTSSLITLGSHSSVNNNTDTFIAYAFHSVDGYSKVGSYTGNGSADGPFVHCGFRPKFVMARVSSAGGNWRMLDAVRSIDNPVGDTLYANNSIGEEVYDAYDFLSNGFKLKQTDGDVNGSGQTYIFIAFAESPFKHTNAR